MTSNTNVIVVLGPTATGKTAFAAGLAAKIHGEIISADSRQVYKGMDIGTGKDYDDYVVNRLKIPYHLIDICDPGYEYSLFEFRRDALKACNQILRRSKTPILCGGTGLYLQAILKGYDLREVPEDTDLRKNLAVLSEEELIGMLISKKPLHNTTDISDRKRLIRAIEIAEHAGRSGDEFPSCTMDDFIVFGIWFERSLLRQRISLRLEKRLKQGLVEEIQQLINNGISADQLRFYGLEYRIITDYVTGIYSYREMFGKLETAIHQFAKRQMTWFRKMEREGIDIHWLEGTLDINEKLEIAMNLIAAKK